MKAAGGQVSTGKFRPPKHSQLKRDDCLLSNRSQNGLECCIVVIVESRRRQNRMIYVDQNTLRMALNTTKFKFTKTAGGKVREFLIIKTLSEVRMPLNTYFEVELDENRQS